MTAEQERAAVVADLIARLEAAGPEMQRELLEACAIAAWGPEAGEVVIRDGDLFDRMCRFDTFLDVEAYVDAALMLVPEGWTYVSLEICARGKPTQHCRASIERMPEGDIDDREYGSGTTLALAIAAAA